MTDTAVFYVSATCNLQCTYCSIDKNPILKQIDNQLKESYNHPDYYLERVHKFFPLPHLLKRIEFWGGESVKVLDRIQPTLNLIFQDYPYVEQIYFSTNFSYDSWNDQIFNFFNFLSKYTPQSFVITLQLSCDGPEYINDAGRGKGTTKKCLNVFNDFVKRVTTELPDNITVNIHLKPTLDIINLKKLDSKEKIIDYYRFFEDNFIEKIMKLNKNNLHIGYPIPNLAEPCPATKEDGLFYANFCKQCAKIDFENIPNRIFKYYTSIRMFSKPIFEIQNLSKYDLFSQNCYCGAGSRIIGILPDNLNSICNEGFTYLLDDYKLQAAKSNREDIGTISFDQYIGDQADKYCLTDEQCKNFENQIALLTKPNEAQLSILTLEIITLALAGQIDKKYINNREALKAAKVFQSHFVYCIKANYNITGTITMIPVGTLRLLLNGALDYIERDYYERINF